MGDRFLEQLLESPVKARVLRFYMHHPGEWLGEYDVARMIRADKKAVRRVIEKLHKLKLLRGHTVRLTKEERAERRGRTPAKEKRYTPNTSFPFYEELQRFVLQSHPIASDTLRKRIQKTGAVKLALLAGVLVDDDVARADLLLVGSNLHDKRVKNLIDQMEAENGRSLRCVVMTTDDFEYRYGLFDRFVRDLVQGKREVLIDRLGVADV